LALERYAGSEPINLGSGEEISIKDLVGPVAEATGYGGEITWDRECPNGQPRRRLDTTRGRELLGFEAQIGLREGIERTATWYRQAPDVRSHR
jgi:GDP-L-fucose synthase